MLVFDFQIAHILPNITKLIFSFFVKKLLLQINDTNKEKHTNQKIIRTILISFLQTVVFIEQCYNFLL